MKMHNLEPGSFTFARRSYRPALAALLTFAVAGVPSVRVEGASQRVEIKDKTLVSWVSVEDLNCRGGSALSLGVNDMWDGLVFGEKVPKKWMAGSEVWHRTPDQKTIAQGEDAQPDHVTQIALVHHGKDAMLLRDGKEIASWKLEVEPPAYGRNGYAMFGWRHMGCTGTNAYLHGSILDARIYDCALSAGELGALKPGEAGGVRPVAWWDFAKGGEDRMGLFNTSELKGNARIAGGRLQLNGDGDYLLCTRTRAGVNRVQFRPNIGVFADPIPFYWKGKYHIFYLQGGVGKVPWHHIVSDNLVDWKELAIPALVSDGAPDSWDGGNMFTGSVIQHNGRFYCFYTGDNGGNPLGNEGVRLATSDDLVHWKKQPDFLVVPEGKIYSDTRIRDFRDPFPYKIPGRNEWWMILCARTVDKKFVAGVYKSADLQNWTPAAPLDADGQECPDLFKVGDMLYLSGADHYSYGKDLRGHFTTPAQRYFDRPGIYAGKRMFDGKRNIWVGWIADTEDLSDGGRQQWGGTMCTPRELIPGPDGILYVRPVKEVVDAFCKDVFDLKSAHTQYDAAEWSINHGQLTNKSAPARVTFNMPAMGMLEMTLKLSGDAELTVAFRTDESGKQEGYLYTIDPSASTVITHGQGINWKRDGCRIDVNKPVNVRAILIGQSIEFFVNDQYAFTRTAYDLAEGKLGMEVGKGSVTLEKLSFKQLTPKGKTTVNN